MNEVKVVRVSTRCTLLDLRMFVDETASCMPGVKADADTRARLKKLEKTVYEDKRIRWEFTEPRCYVVETILRSTMGDAYGWEEISNLLTLCSLPRKLAREIEVDLRNVPHFKPSEKLKKWWDRNKDK